LEPGSKFLRRQAPSLLAVLVLQAKPWLTETVNYWATDINAGPVPSGLGTDSRRTYAWQRQCRQHFAELTVQAANKSGSWVNCIYCQRQESLPKGWHVASYYAATAAELLRLVRGVRHIFTEAKVLKGTCGAFDSAWCSALASRARKSAGWKWNWMVSSTSASPCTAPQPTSSGPQTGARMRQRGSTGAAWCACTIWTARAGYRCCKMQCGGQHCHIATASSYTAQAMGCATGLGHGR